MNETLTNWFIEKGLSDGLAAYAGWIVLTLLLLIAACLANFIARKIVLAAVSYFIRRTKTVYDDALLKHKVFNRLSHIAPALVIYYSASLFPPVQTFVERFSVAYMVITGLAVFFAFLNAIAEIYRTFEVSRQRPIKGYIQVVKIIVSLFIGVVVITTIMGKSVWPVLSGFGAMTAILILVFKDSILGLVASIQLSSYDMVRIGDWIEMPKYGADGDVIDVSLNTIKVQNWDKTITTIPAYNLISDSFKNWRGMSESGGRRIKRSINIDIRSIKFCTAEMLARFEKFQLIGEYLKSKREEIAKHNAEHDVDTSELINGRNLTNVGTFRAYVGAYLRNHSKIHNEMTFLIRQLQPGEHGLPIEIYVFSNDQVWANYEAIQADIFDHILAVIPMFELRVFQYPTGNDLNALTTRSSA